MIIPKRFITLFCLTTLFFCGLPNPDLLAQEPAGDVVETGAAESQADESTSESGASDSDSDSGEYFGQSLIEKLQKGGITVVLLGLLSVAGLTFALECMSRFKKKHIIPDGLVDDVEAAWVAGDFPKAIQACQAQPSTAGRILETYVRYRDVSSPELSPIAGEIASRDLKRHLQRAYPLAVIGAVAPLLGLMGTVFGMIESFETVAVAGSMGDASILADGISKALVTTAVGLVVAVPFLLLYHMFKTKITLFAIDLEEQINEFTKRVFLKRSEVAAEEVQ